MAEYIEREAIIAIIEERQKALCPLGRFSRNEIYGDARKTFDNWQDFADLVDGFPAANVAPVKHGRWESHLMPLAFKCSCCGYKATAKEWKFHAMRYCPACGCMMENGKNERN